MGNGGREKHAFGCSSQNEISNTRVSICSHDKKISIVRVHIGIKRITNCAPCGINCLKGDIYAMASQMLCEFRSRLFGINHLLIRDCYNAHTLCFFQDRKRVCDGPGRGPTEIPRHATTTVSSTKV